MDLEATFGADKQDKTASNCEEDIFNHFEKSDEVNELMKTVNETQIGTAIHEQDHNYMDELLSYIGEGNNDGMDMTENRNEDESEELTKLLETQNSSDSAVDRFMIRDIISPMSIDSGIGSDSGAMSLAKYSSHPGQNYNQRWNYLDRPHSTATTPSSSPVLRSSTPGFEPDNYGFEIENYSTSRSNTPTSDTSSAFNSKLVESATSDCFPISESIISCKSPDMMVGVNQGDNSDSCQDMVGVSQDEEDSDTSEDESEGGEEEEAEDNLETLRNNKSHKEGEQISPSNTQDGTNHSSSNSNPTSLSSNSSSSNSNPFIVSSNPSSSISNPTTLSLPLTSSNYLPISSDSILSNVDRTSTMSNFPPSSSNSVVTSSISCHISPIPNPSPPISLETQNPVETTSNFLETSSNVPISSSSSSVSWKVEIIDNSKRNTPSNPYKEREKAYWKKRKREDKNEPVKRKKVLWSFEEPVRSCKKECSSSHYSYEEDDDFDDLYMFSDMVGVNPGEDSEPSEDSEDSDTSEDESEEEEVETLTNNKSSDTNRNSPIVLHHTPPEDSNEPHDKVDPPYLEDPNVPDPRINNDLEYLNTPNTSPSPLESSQCIASNDSNLLCDPNNSSSIYPEVPSSRPSTKRTSSASPEFSSSRSSLKRKCPFPSDPSSSVIIPELKLDIEEDPEKSTETRSNFPRLRSLRPRSGAQIKKEEFKTPETPEYPSRCLTKRSRNRDRKVKLYEKGKMANEKDEARRLRALQVKLNRDRIKFEGIRRDERLKELEKENETLREEAEERRVKECEGEKRKVDLEHALEESRRREEELLKLLEEAKKREEQLISEVRERQEKEEEEELEEAGGGIGKEAVNPQGLWTLAPPRSTVRLSHACANKLNLFLIGFVLFWSLSRRYRKNR